MPFYMISCHKYHKCLFTASHGEMKCNKLLQVCRHDVNMSVTKKKKKEDVVAIDQWMNNIIMEANLFFKMFVFIYFFLYFVICG